MGNFCRNFSGFALLFLLAGPRMYAADQREGSGGSEHEVITGDQAAAILDELRAIRGLLEKQQNAAPARPEPLPQTVRMPIGKEWHSIGREDAPVTLVEFADYQCPFCRRFQVETFAQLKKDFIDPGKLRFISRDLPLDFHANALFAAEAARCAGDQGKYWEMRDALMSGTAGLSHEAIIRYAQSLALDREGFAHCLDGETYKTAIQKDLVDAQMLKISGTPTFILGKTDKEAIDGVRIVGAQPYSAFETAILRLLPASQDQGLYRETVR